MELASTLYVPITADPTPDAVLKSLTPDPTLTDNERVYVEIRTCVLLLYHLGLSFSDDQKNRWEALESGQRVAWVNALEKRIEGLTPSDDADRELMKKFVDAARSATMGDEISFKNMNMIANGTTNSKSFQKTVQRSLGGVSFNDEGSMVKFYAYSKRIQSVSETFNIISKRVKENLKTAIETEFGNLSTGWMGCES